MKKIQIWFAISAVVFALLTLFFLARLVVPGLMGDRIVTLLDWLLPVAASFFAFGCGGFFVYLVVRRISEKQARRLGLSWILKWISITFIAAGMWISLKTHLLREDFLRGILAGVPFWVMGVLIVAAAIRLSRISLRQLTQILQSREENRHS